MGKIFGTMPLVGKTSLGVEPIVSPYLFLGFGLHLLWLCAVVYQSFPSYYVADPQTAAMYSEVGIVTLFAAITTLMVMGWLIDRITYYIRLHKVQIVIAAIMAASTAMLFVAQFVTLYPLLIGGGFVAGASGAFITLIWAEAFRRRDSISIVMNTILALLTALMGFGLMFWTVPRHLHGLVLSLVPLLSLAGLFMVMHGIKAFKGNQEFTIDTDGNKLPVYGVRELPTFRRLRVGKRQFLARIGVPSLLLGLSYGTFSIRTMSVVNHLDVTDLGVGAVFISASVIALFLVVLLLALIDEAELGGFFRFMLPVLVVIMITLTMVEGELPPLFFSFLAFVLFSAIIWISYCELSHRYRISPILVLGFGLGVLIIGQLLAEMLISLGGAVLPSAALPLHHLRRCHRADAGRILQPAQRGRHPQHVHRQLRGRQRGQAAGAGGPLQRGHERPPEPRPLRGALRAGGQHLPADQPRDRPLVSAGQRPQRLAHRQAAVHQRRHRAHPHLAHLPQARRPHPARADRPGGQYR